MKIRDIFTSIYNFPRQHHCSARMKFAARSKTFCHGRRELDTSPLPSARAYLAESKAPIVHSCLSPWLHGKNAKSGTNIIKGLKLKLTGNCLDYRKPWLLLFRRRPSQVPVHLATLVSCWKIGPAV